MLAWLLDSFREMSSCHAPRARRWCMGIPKAAANVGRSLLQDFMDGMRIGLAGHEGSCTEIIHWSVLFQLAADIRMVEK